MSHTKVAKAFLSGALAIFALVGALPVAEAAPVKVRFTPPYGAPFPNLEWFGEAVIDDGACTNSGTVLNFAGPCAGEFSFTSATVYLADVSAPTVALQTINFTGGQVAVVERSSPAPADWTKVYSSPFTPVKGTIAQTLYDPPGATPADNAYFSLIFVGGYAQLYWFQKDPGEALVNPLAFPYVQFPNVLTYAGCYLAGPGDNQVGHNRCGLSSNLEGAGAILKITPVPEPSTYAMMFAGLAALAFLGRRRARKA